MSYYHLVRAKIGKGSSFLIFFVISTLAEERRRGTKNPMGRRETNVLVAFLPTSELRAIVCAARRVLLVAGGNCRHKASQMHSFRANFDCVGLVVDCRGLQCYGTFIKICPKKKEKHQYHTGDTGITRLWWQRSPPSWNVTYEKSLESRNSLFVDSTLQRVVH